MANWAYDNYWLKTQRKMRLRGTITFTDGGQFNLYTGVYTRDTGLVDEETDLPIYESETWAEGGAEIFTYSCTNSAGGEGLNIGGTEAGTFSLELGKGNIPLRTVNFEGAEVHMSIYIVITSTGATTSVDFGVWYVDSADVSEQGGTFTLSGRDALATKFEMKYGKNSYFDSRHSASICCSRICRDAGIPYSNTSFPNGDAIIDLSPYFKKDPDSTLTAREILSYVAVNVGGYITMGRNGKMYVCTYQEVIDSELNINASFYSTLTRSSVSPLHIRRVEAELPKASTDSDSDETEVVVFDYSGGESIVPNPSNTVKVDYVPSLIAENVNAWGTALSEKTFTGGSVTWVGCPYRDPCAYTLNVTDTKGESVKVYCQSETYTFDGGLTCTTSFSVPTVDFGSTSSYTTAGSTFDAHGNINVKKISDLDKEVLHVQEGHFEKVTAEEIETDKLTSKIIEAVNINTRKLTADKIEAEEAAINFLKSGEITADAITTGTLDATKITVKGTIDAQEVVGDLGTFVDAKIGNANIDYANIKIADIATGTLDNLIVRDQSTMSNVWIDRLKVRNAQLITATVEELVVKANDGQYYRLDIDTNGAITPVNVTEELSDGEITAGITSDGHATIIETDLTVTDLATTTFAATSALIHEKLTADMIDVGKLFAREATVNEISTMHITGKDGMPLSIIVANAEADSATLKKYFGFTPQGLVTRSYTIDESGVETESNWSTLTDNTGFHIDNKEKSGHVASFAKDRLTAPSIDVGGRVVMRKSSNGGMKWVVSVRGN